MKSALPILLLLVAFCLTSRAVLVHEGDFTFPLETVKALKDLMTVDAAVDAARDGPNPRVASTGTVAVCSNPALPQDFVMVCQSRRAAYSMSRLAYIAYNSDVCEICAYAACTGC